MQLHKAEHVTDYPTMDALSGFLRWLRSTKLYQKPSTGTVVGRRVEKLIKAHVEMAQEINKINLEEESKGVAYACNFNFSNRKKEDKRNYMARKKQRSPNSQNNPNMVHWISYCTINVWGAIKKTMFEKTIDRTSSGSSSVSCSSTNPKTFRVAKTLFLFTVVRSNLDWQIKSKHAMVKQEKSQIVPN